MLLVTLALAAYFYDSARWFSDDAQRVTRVSAALSETEAIAREAFASMLQLEEAVRLGQPGTRPIVAESVAATRGSYDRLRTLAESGEPLAGSAMASLDELERASDALYAGAQGVESALLAGDLDGAAAALGRLNSQGVVSRFQGLIVPVLQEQRRALDELGQTAVSQADYVIRLLPIVMLLLVVVTAFVGWRLSRRVSRSLGTLQEAAQAYGSGALSHRVPTLEEQDFNRLGQGFNDMAVALDGAGRQLRESNVSLEAKVEERTRALKESAEQLSAVDEHRRRLLAEISHEFRTPLTVIRGEAEIALRSKHPSDDELREAFRRIIDTTEHATGLVEDLLFIVRADAGEPRLQLQEVELMGLLSSVCEEFGGKAAARNLEIRYLGGVDHAMLQGDPRRLRQVFAILLDNALRYSHAGGHVEVEAALLDDRIEVQVRDQGIGLDEEAVSQAFERFYRGRQAQSHAEQGTGLGLPVAKAIVDAHGGDIDLQARQEGGAVALVVFPIESRLRVVA
jgi:signal transduction histidine kinase